MITFYTYANCNTCQKAKKYLTQKGYEFKEIDITLNPPSKSLLKGILKEGNYSIKDLFNKSGVLYREMKMKDKINSTSESDLLELLATNGKLIKRPIITDKKKSTVGFREAEENAW